MVVVTAVTFSVVVAAPAVVVVLVVFSTVVVVCSCVDAAVVSSGAVVVCTVVSTWKKEKTKLNLKISIFSPRYKMKFDRPY
jgi:hypothetical protein